MNVLLRHQKVTLYKSLGGSTCLRYNKLSCSSHFFFEKKSLQIKFVFYAVFYPPSNQLLHGSYLAFMWLSTGFNKAFIQLLSVFDIAFF